MENKYKYTIYGVTEVPIITYGTELIYNEIGLVTIEGVIGDKIDVIFMTTDKVSIIIELI